MVVGKLPYEEYIHDQYQFFANVVANAARPEVADETTVNYPMLTQLMVKCWAQDPTTRPSLLEITSTLSHHNYKKCLIFQII